MNAPVHLLQLADALEDVAEIRADLALLLQRLDRAERLLRSASGTPDVLEIRPGTFVVDVNGERGEP